MTTTTQNTTPIHIGIMGASGRMGRMLIQAVLETPDTVLAGAFVPAEFGAIGMDAGEFIGVGNVGVPLSVLTDDTPKLDVLIDFSLPDALPQTLAYCTKHRTALVIGVTGLSEDELEALNTASTQIALVYAGNYSTGVNLSLNLLATTAQVLGLDADVEIIEAHHKHKLDAPSGTALMMAQSVAQARNQVLGDVLVHGRSGSAKRRTGDIGMHAIRGGEIVGEHTVQFIMGGELIEITHKAQSRMTFATGAVRAALWAYNKPIGRYDMQDVLGLKD
ncbi:MAG: 4-hydroxy-tetrahydrodipicolinate reductase [Moraxella sp.]|nr:4-hydroxy-tetrahydrodipicolinate reductase [Moraxella sp.]